MPIVDADSTTITSDKVSLYGFIATAMTLSLLGSICISLIEIFHGADPVQLLRSPTGGILYLLTAMMTALLWRMYVISKRPLMRIGREGIEFNLGVAIVENTPLRLLVTFGLVRPRFGWIPWYQLQCVKPRAKVNDDQANAGFSGALFLEGAVLPKQDEGANPTGAPLGNSAAIRASDLKSTPARVAAKIQPYLDDPNRRQSLPSLFPS